MISISFPAILKPDVNGDGFVVNFPDLPEALTDGRDLDDALSEAADCLQEALAGRLVRKEDIPVPSKPKRGQHLVQVALYLAPKLALYLAMRERGINNRELARRLGSSETAVRQMLNPKRDTRPETLQAALQALGKRVLVAVEDAA